MKRHFILLRVAASWLPAVTPPLVIVIAGLLAFGQHVRLAEAEARGAVMERIEAARPDVAEALSQRFASIRALAAALEADPPTTQAEFTGIASRLTAGIPGFVAARVETADGRRLIHPYDDARARRAGEALEGMANPANLGTLEIERESAVFLSPATDETAPPARVTLVVTEKSLLPLHGTVEETPVPSLTFLPRPDELDGRPDARTRAAEVRLPEGSIGLGATVQVGWRDVPGEGWLITLLTFLSAGLVVAPMARTRHLANERRRNIRELGRRKTELTRLSQRHSLALDASRVGVWDYDIANDVLVWDGRMDEIYGYGSRPGPRVYRDWVERIHPEDLARAQADFADAIERSAGYDTRFRIVLEDGTLRHIQAKGAVYSTPETGTRIVGVNWDVSEQTRLNSELLASKQEAETASLAKSQFLATMSHEIRTPMNGILGMLDLLLRSDLDPEQRERLEIAYGSAEHLLTILNDILEFSKLEADRIDLQLKDVDARAIVRETVTLMSAAAQAHAVSLETEIDPELPERIVADPTRLRQILLNLVGNAIKFTEGGTIAVSASYDHCGKVVSFAVRDTGIGIPPEAIPGLFQRFAQVDSSDTRARGGTGLGLAICKQLVEIMDGGISVRSVETLGSTFTFWFPAEPGATASNGRSRAARTPLDPSPRPLRILVAEDNPTNQIVFKAFLDLAGHSVEMTGNGRDCVDRAMTGTFDVIIMDVQMPKMDGVEATRLIRSSNGPAAKTPIIALTANASRSDRDRYVAAGMDTHVGKPVSIDVLNEAIAAITQGLAPDHALDAVPLGKSATARPSRSRGRSAACPIIPPPATIPLPGRTP